MSKFYTLFGVNVNIKVIVIISGILYLMFPGLSVFSFLTIIITLHQFILFYNSIGSVIPIRYLFGLFMCLQILFGPMLAYNGLDKFQAGYYRMQISEFEYFKYAIFAVIAFILGLHIRAGKLNGEIVDEKRILLFVHEYPTVPYLFIVIGFISSIVSEYFSTDLAFVFYLLAGFKFIGAFLIIIGNRKLKLLPLILVYGSIIVSSLGASMFHDLLTWIIFLFAVFAIKFKPGDKIKLISVTLFFLFALAIQQLKGNYREATWQRGEEGNIETLNKAYNETQEQNNFFSYKSLAVSNVRFNQGFIVTNIMKNVPSNIPFENGAELILILEAAFLPRFLAPDKLTAGNQAIFKKYSGMALSKNTSMGLSSIGDAYINFGIIGGCLFMFILGVFFSMVLNIFYRMSKGYPILLLFTPLVFYYPIRPDCEFQTLLGHLVKCCFLIFVIFFIWKKQFRVRPAET